MANFYGYDRVKKMVDDPKDPSDAISLKYYTNQQQQTRLYMYPNVRPDNTIRRVTPLVTGVQNFMPIFTTNINERSYLSLKYIMFDTDSGGIGDMTTLRIGLSYRTSDEKGTEKHFDNLKDIKLSDFRKTKIKMGTGMLNSNTTLYECWELYHKKIPLNVIPNYKKIQIIVPTLKQLSGNNNGPECLLSVGYYNVLN